MAIDTTTIIADLSGLLLILGSVGAGARWYIKQHSVDTFKEYLDELKPNHGSSLNDAIKLHILPAVNELRDDVKELKLDLKELREENLQMAKDIARLEGRMQAHIEDPRP